MATSRLLRKEKYPWGTSVRTYIPKPGDKVKRRPLTIPPFMDRVVQQAISMVLQCIYEPWFEKMNRSFGFRPHYGVHDAITAVRSRLNIGMRTALEGDIESAYDSVNRNKLIKLLRQRIRDDKFLRLIKQRLQYEYIEEETGLRVKPTKGIPQGGTDSPYLFNIYMMSLDIFVLTKIRKYLNSLNQKSHRPMTSNYGP